MNNREDLSQQIKDRRTDIDIIKNFYIVRHTHSFFNKYEDAEIILTEVSNYLGVDISSILITGSAKLGFSLVSNTNFTPGKSDLDLAIVDSHLFARYFDRVLKETNGYLKKQLFMGDDFKRYINLLGKGVFHPKYLPNIDMKRDSLSFFSKISSNYRDYYSSISVCIYLSETAFQNKQRSALNQWINDYNSELIGK